MKRNHLIGAVLIAALVWLAGPGRAEPTDGEAVDAPAVQPVRTDTAVPAAPVRMLAEQAQPLLEEARRRAAAKPGPRPETAESQQGVGRIIEVDVPAVVNRSPEFRFRDVTRRAGEGEAQDLPQLTMEERRRRVEAFRRAIERRKERER